MKNDAASHRCACRFRVFARRRVADRLRVFFNVNRVATPSAPSRSRPKLRSRNQLRTRNSLLGAWKTRICRGQRFKERATTTVRVCTKSRARRRPALSQSAVVFCCCFFSPRKTELYIRAAIIRREEEARALLYIDKSAMAINFVI